MTKLDYTWNLKRWAVSLDAEGIVSASNIKSSFVSDYIDTTFYEKSTLNYLAWIVRPSLTYKFKGIGSFRQSILSP